MHLTVNTFLVELAPFDGILSTPEELVPNVSIACTDVDLKTSNAVMPILSDAVDKLRVEHIMIDLYKMDQNKLATEF